MNKLHADVLLHALRSAGPPGTHRVTLSWLDAHLWQALPGADLTATVHGLVGLGLLTPLSGLAADDPLFRWESKS